MSRDPASALICPTKLPMSCLSGPSLALNPTPSLSSTTTLRRAMRSPLAVEPLADMISNSLPATAIPNRLSNHFTITSPPQRTSTFPSAYQIGTSTPINKMVSWRLPLATTRSDIFDHIFLPSRKAILPFTTLRSFLRPGSTKKPGLCRAPGRLILPMITSRLLMAPVTRQSTATNHLFLMATPPLWILQHWDPSCSSSRCRTSRILLKMSWGPGT